MPEPVFHAAVDHDCERALAALAGGGIGNRRAGFLGLLQCLSDVFDRDVGPHDRLLMRRQRLSDADQGSVGVGGNPGQTEIGLLGAEGEPVHALVKLSHGVDVVADDLHVVNGHVGILSRSAPIGWVPGVLSRPSATLTFDPWESDVREL